VILKKSKNSTDIYLIAVLNVFERKSSNYLSGTISCFMKITDYLRFLKWT
jgi:hypothetical protein